MKRLSSAISRVRDLLFEIAQWGNDLVNPPYRTIFAEAALPPKLARRTLYVVAEDGYQEHVAMLCPCGREHVLYLNLIPDERPCWRLTLHGNGSATLHPSIWRQKDCRSHFWFRKGRVVWV